MKKSIFIIFLLVFNLQATYTQKVKMTSVTFVIPSDKNTIVIQRNCQWCHSYGYILNQGKQSKDFWNKVVVKMRDIYKAPISARDDKLATDYLFKYFGNTQEK